MNAFICILLHVITFVFTISYNCVSSFPFSPCFCVGMCVCGDVCMCVGMGDTVLVAHKAGISPVIMTTREWSMKFQVDETV